MQRKTVTENLVSGTTSTTAVAVAEALIQIGAVGFALEKPITFKSGLVSPVYVDNRILPYHPQAWEVVLKGLAETIATHQLKFDCLAGIETAGIPHSAALGYILKKPSVFVRKQLKDHGTKKQVEGGEVSGKQVLLLEDHVTTGLSSLAGVTALRAAQAAVSTCLAITCYDFPETLQAFNQANVQLLPLTTFPVILEVATRQGILTQKQQTTILTWLRDPWGWVPPVSG